MRQDLTTPSGELLYKAGLDRLEEPVVSSHFMHRLCNDLALDNYNDDEFHARSQFIPIEAVFNVLIPALVGACRAFCLERLSEIKTRAQCRFKEYGLSCPDDVWAAHFLAEFMFDPNYSKTGEKYYSRQLLSSQLSERIKAGVPIRMVIPALPFKISSPLKSRGPLPDLAEVNFLLQLYEIALIVQLLYREARPDVPGQVAAFVVVSDGSRFSALVGECESVVRNYRLELIHWTQRLGIADLVTIYDYRALLSETLSPAMQEWKLKISASAAAEYADVLWSIFDPIHPAVSLRLAADVEPDPERANPEGRFASLLKSLVYTINYKALASDSSPALSENRQLYRELTGHIFEPYVAISSAEIPRILQELQGRGAISDKAKEYLRQSMFQEVWEATILYLAEIKSDRELPKEPILNCLPDHIRWTIHAKRGQLALAVPTALGLSVQAWAGAAVFKQAKKGKIRLCTLPVLALEGAGAIPVRVQDSNNLLGLGNQPLFYIYPDAVCASIKEFLSKLSTSLVRRRAA